MPQQAELAAIVQPEVDDRALEQEAETMGSRLDEAARLTPDIDTRQIQRQLEQAIPGGQAAGTVLDMVRGGGGADAGGAGGQASPSGAMPGQGQSVQLAQLEVLEDIQDLLERMGATGGPTGGGGGVAAGGGAASRVAGALGTGAGLSTMAAGGLATLGLTATAFAPEGAGRQFTGLEGKPTGPVFQALFGGETKEQTLRNARRQTTGSTEPPLKDITVEKPAWLSTLTGATVAKPDWLSTLADPDISEPDWLTDFSSPSLTEPTWLSDLTSLSFPKPPWLSTIQQFATNTSGTNTPTGIINGGQGGVRAGSPTTGQDEGPIPNVTVNVGGVEITLGEGQIERIIQRELEKKIPDIAKEAKNLVEGEFFRGPGSGR